MPDGALPWAASLRSHGRDGFRSGPLEPRPVAKMRRPGRSHGGAARGAASHSSSYTPLDMWAAPATKISRLPAWLAGPTIPSISIRSMIEAARL